MSDTHTAAVAIVERSPITDNMSPVVRMGMEILGKNPSPEALEKLLAVQKDYEQNEARKAYAVAMVSLKGSLPTTLGHNKPVKFGTTNYSYTTMAAVCDQLIPVLARYGFALTFDPSTSERGVTVKCQLRHAGGHVEESVMSAPNDTTGPMKNPAQQALSSVTRLQRYLMLSMLGVATGDMPDADDNEPEAPDPSGVDSARNLRVVASLKKYGHKREEAEAIVGREVSEWTAADVEEIRAWCVGKPAPEPQSAELVAVLSALASCQSDKELRAVAPHTEKLSVTEIVVARDAYKARAAELRGGT